MSSGSSSQVFDSYERRYCELSSAVSRDLSSLPSLAGEQKKQRVAELKTGLDEAESLIRRMDLEARSLQPAQKSALLTKLREYKLDMNNLKREVKRLSTGSDNLAYRDDLLESRLADSAVDSADQKERLLKSTERLNQTGQRIKDSQRSLIETEELGVSILQDLHQQRQTLLHANVTLHGVDDNIGRSKKILKSMAARMSRNKWIMGSLIGVLLIIIALIVYFRVTN